MGSQNQAKRRAWINRKFSELREDFGGKCQTCGIKSNKSSTRPNLQFAHIKPTKLNGRGRGKLARYYDIKNNQACYVLECFECHRKRDYGDTETDPGF